MVPALFERSPRVKLQTLNRLSGRRHLSSLVQRTGPWKDWSEGREVYSGCKSSSYDDKRLQVFDKITAFTTYPYGANAFKVCEIELSKI